MGIKKYTAEQAADIISSAAEEYRDKLAGRRFVIVYNDRVSNRADYKVVKFTQGHFQHLTGIQYEGNMNAKDFYKMCLNHLISPKNIRFNPKGYTHLKLSVLPYLSELLYHKFWIGESINNDLTINADYFAGDTKCVMSLGFRYAKEDYPVSLKRQSIREVVKKENDVYAVYMKKVNESSSWECVYCKDGFVLDSLGKEAVWRELVRILDLRGDNEQGV